MKIIQLNTLDAYFNLAVEEYVFFHMDPVEDYFLLWQNHSAVVVGKHQNPVEEINIDFINDHQVQVARRLSGGGAVYHDLGNLNYSTIVHSDEMRWEIKRMADPVVEALIKCGVDVQLNNRNDLQIAGKKISGSSQYIKGKRLLHHGTLLFHSDLKSLSLSLKPGDDQIESRSIKSVRSPVTNICDHYPHVTIKEFTAKLREVIKENSTVEEYELTHPDLEGITALREEKYSTWEWIYGRSPEYSIRKVRQYNGFEVGISLMVKSGVIQALNLEGDVVEVRDFNEIERYLIGVRLNVDDLNEALSPLKLNLSKNGINSAELARIIFQ
jgi:lipoate-protein ligase A